MHASRRIWRTRGHGKRGQSLVEMTVAIPVLLMILLGTIDMGRAFFDYIQIRSAVIDGATYASRNPTAALSEIESEVTGSGVPAGTLVSKSTTGVCDVSGGNGKVTVSAETTFTPITSEFFLDRMGFGAMTLRASSTMRCLT